MPEESDGFTVSASLRKVLPDIAHLEIIEDAVQRVHRITIDATELLTLHVTRCLEEDLPLPEVSQDFVKMVMMEVSIGEGRRTKLDEELTKTRMQYMPSLKPTHRQRLDQILMAQSISLAASFRTNVWKHFPQRLYRYVRLCRAGHLTARGVESKVRKLRMMKMVGAICEGSECDNEDRQWVDEQRNVLGCCKFTKKSVESNGKLHTNVMLSATWIINRALEDAELRCVSCCPTRRQLRPAFCNIDTKALCTLLRIPQPKGKGAFAEQQQDIWNNVFTLGNDVIKGVKHKVFAGSFRTDGVSARLLFNKPSRSSGKRKRGGDPVRLERFPRRGIYAIDQLKHLSRDIQLIGADPGKRELLVCVDANHPELRSVRYTAAQRRDDTHVAHHAREEASKLPDALRQNLQGLSEHNSRSSYLLRQRAYFTHRRTFLDSAIDHYKGRWLRKRAWERHIRSQRSFTDFVRRIHSLQNDKAVPIALAYGSWGGIAGKPGAACNNGLPPCIGIGLRHKLSRHFVVISTPEAYTSKTCSLCGSTCGPCEEVDDLHRTALLEKATTDVERHRAMGFSVRGLRHCHNAECAAHLNRDSNAAVNIQRRCESILTGAPIPLSGDEVDRQLETWGTWMKHGERHLVPLNSGTSLSII